MNYEPLFSREWPGTERVCKTAKDKDETQESSNNFRFYSISDGDSCDGEILDPIAPIEMTAIHDMIPCARRGGPTFVETIKVDQVTLKCAEEFVPCSTITKPAETVCVREEDKATHCPILDIYVIHELAIDQVLA